MFEANSQRGDSISPRAHAIPAKNGIAAAKASAARHCAPTEELAIAPAITASEKWIDDNFLRLQAWRKDFEKNQGREPTTADVTLADPEILGIARRLGAFGL